VLPYFQHKEDILISLFEEEMKQVRDHMKKQINLEYDPGYSPRNRRMMSLNTGPNISNSNSGNIMRTVALTSLDGSGGFPS
jgi:hypothetical protein